MKKLTVFMTIFIVFLVGVLLYIGYSIENSNKEYLALENDLVEIAKAYIIKGKLSVVSGSSIQIKTSEMIQDHYLNNNLEVNGDKCDGYVTIKRGIDNYEYIPYIKCDKYESVTN